MSWDSKKRWLHVEFTKLRNTAGQLQVRLHSFKDSHVREADLADELELGVLTERWNCLSDFEHAADDVVRGIAKGPARMLVRWIW